MLEVKVNVQIGVTPEVASLVSAILNKPAGVEAPKPAAPAAETEAPAEAAAAPAARRGRPKKEQAAQAEAPAEQPAEAAAPAADPKPEDAAPAALTPRVLLLQGVATSIDALSVGFTVSALPFAEALTEALIIGGVTFGVCLVGLLLGGRLGERLTNRAGYLGGAILIGIGIEIFVKGVFF